MNTWRTIALLTLLAGGFASPWAQAQTVYRCGNTYSENPCAGGKAVKVDDPRTKQEKAKADADTEAATKTAKQLERERLAAEDGELPSKRRTTLKAAGGKPGSGDAQSAGGRASSAKPALNYFTAAVPPPPKESRSHKASDADNSTRP